MYIYLYIRICVTISPELYYLCTRNLRCWTQQEPSVQICIPQNIYALRIVLDFRNILISSLNGSTQQGLSDDLNLSTNTKYFLIYAVVVSFSISSQQTVFNFHLPRFRFYNDFTHQLSYNCDLLLACGQSNENFTGPLESLISDVILYDCSVHETKYQKHCLVPVRAV